MIHETTSEKIHVNGCMDVIRGVLFKHGMPTLLVCALVSLVVALIELLLLLCAACFADHIRKAAKHRSLLFSPNQVSLYILKVTSASLIRFTTRFHDNEISSSFDLAFSYTKQSWPWAYSWKSFQRSFPNGSAWWWWFRLRRWHGRSIARLIHGKRWNGWE